MSFTSWGNSTSTSAQPKKLGFDSWSFKDKKPEADSWGSSSSTVSDGFSKVSEDWSTGSWRLNDSLEDHSGTKNPQNDPERVRRIEHLEYQITTLRENVRDGDLKVDEAKRRLDELKETLRNTRESASQAREGHNRLGNEVAGLKGKRDGNKMKIRELKDRLSWTNDTWTINEIRAEISQRQENRWPIADEISRKTDEYQRVTDKMHECENRVRELEYSVETAVNNVDQYREEHRQRKEKLAEYKQELENLKNPW